MNDGKRADLKGMLRRMFLPVLLLVFCFVLGGSMQASAAAKKQPTQITLNKTLVKMITGQTFTLEATIKPKAAANAKVTWKSSDESIAKVSKKGKVSLVGVGKARITASTENGKKASCTVYAQKYSCRLSINGNKYTITTPEDSKTYTAYSQYSYGFYYSAFGCVTTAVSIVASAYGKYYTPVQIHTGPANAPYSERYAVTKLGKVRQLNSCYGAAAISVRTAAHILANMGIRCRPYYNFDRATALEQIRAHLKKGKPAIIKANNNTYNGIRLANVHHAQVLVGLTDDDRAILINPGHHPVYRTSIKLEDLLYHHMTPASGDYSKAYMLDVRTAGGYILVDGPEK